MKTIFVIPSFLLMTLLPFMIGLTWAYYLQSLTVSLVMVKKYFYQALPKNS